MHYHNASKDASICSKCNAFVHYLTYYKRFYLRFVGGSFKYRTFSVPSYKAEEFILIHPHIRTIAYAVTCLAIVRQECRTSYK